MGDQDGRRAGEQALQHGRVVHQHVAGRGAHEHLDAGHLARIDGGHGVEIVVRDAEMEGVIGQRIARRYRLLFCHGGHRQRRRPGVRHVHETGDAPRHSRRRLGRYAALVGQPRLAEMHLVVDHAGQQPLPGGVDFLVGTSHDARRDLVDAAMTNQQVALEDAAFVDQAGVANEQRGHGQNSFCRRL